MFHTLLVPDVTLLQKKDEIHHWENHPFTGAWPETEHKKADNNITKNRTIKKKSKRVRTSFTTDQLRTLEKTFLKNKYINADNRRELCKQLQKDDKCIKTWFQNRRMKEKRESSECSDSSSEISRDLISPPLTQHDQEFDHKTDVYHHQYNHQTPYYEPQTFCTYKVNMQDQLYEPHTNGYNPVNSSVTFINDNTPYPTQYYPSDEARVNNFMYQNQYQYNNEMFNWCPDIFDSYAYYQ